MKTDQQMRQVVVFYPHELKLGERAPTIPVDEKPKRLWTLFASPEAQPTLPIVPIHHHNAFLEDYLHDWNWRNGELRYGSRVTSGRVWLLLEYEQEAV